MRVISISLHLTGRLTASWRAVKVLRWCRKGWVASGCHAASSSRPSWEHQKRVELPKVGKIGEHRGQVGELQASKVKHSEGAQGAEVLPA